MKSLFHITICLFSLLLLTQCQNEIIEPEDDPTTTPLKINKVKTLIGLNEYALFNVEDQIDREGSFTFTVNNLDDLENRIKVTSDGLIAYNAPNDIGNEIIEVEVEDQETGEKATANIEIQIQTDPVGASPCYRNVIYFEYRVQDDPLTIPFSELTIRDTACGNVPTGDFELVFEPNYLEYRDNGDGTLTIDPLPGSAPLDGFVYKGKYQGLDSAYLTYITVTNVRGCSPFAFPDNFTIDRNADNRYRLDVADNDGWCDWLIGGERSVFLAGTQQPKHGTINVVDDYFFEYIPNDNAVYPITENLDYGFRYKQGNYSSSRCCTQFTFTIQ